MQIVKHMMKIKNKRTEGAFTKKGGRGQRMLARLIKTAYVPVGKSRMQFRVYSIIITSRYVACIRN